MSNYIERYWRDAKPEDAIRTPPMVARFWSTGDGWKNEDKLYGVDRSSKDYRWKGDGVQSEFCQVYDAPDPGEGWRLIDTDKETPQFGDEYYDRNGQWVLRSLPSLRWTGQDIYRRRITPTVTYVPFTWGDRKQLPGRWVAIKQQNKTLREEQICNVAETEGGDCYINGYDPVYLLKNATFLDTGKPVGKEVVK